jgi:hypothetical protein
MGKRGFLDEQQRISKLKDKKPILKKLSVSKSGGGGAE